MRVMVPVELTTPLAAGATSADLPFDISYRGTIVAMLATALTGDIEMVRSLYSLQLLRPGKQPVQETPVSADQCANPLAEFPSPQAYNWPVSPKAKWFVRIRNDTAAVVMRRATVTLVMDIDPAGQPDVEIIGG